MKDLAPDIFPTIFLDGASSEGKNKWTLVCFLLYTISSIYTIYTISSRVYLHQWSSSVFTSIKLALENLNDFTCSPGCTSFLRIIS